TGTSSVHRPRCRSSPSWPAAFASWSGRSPPCGTGNPSPRQESGVVQSRMSTPRQQTIRRAQEVRGVGLHTGGEATLRLVPAPVDTGIVFRRVDLPDAPDIPALVGHVVSTDR